MPAERAALQERHGIPRWMAGGGLYGTRAQVREQKREMRAMVGQHARVRFIDARKIERLQALMRGLRRAERLPGLAATVEKLARRVLGKSLVVMDTLPHAYSRSCGEPTDHFLRFAYYKARRPLPDVDPDPARDGGGLIWFAPSLPFTGHHLSELIGLCEPLYAEYGFDFSAVVMGQNARTLSLVMGISYYKDSPSEAARADALYRRLLEVTTVAGYPRYRVSAPHQAHALDDAPEYRAVVEQLRGALDPDGILAPGRYGIGAPR